MSQQSLRGARRLRLAEPMTARDPDEEFRAATPLELFFDLVFVVAVALAANRLHVALVEGDVGAPVVRYALVFFAIWWAWMNFTWFASAYDTDDVAYRIFVFVTMTGALILATGVPRIFDDFDFRIAVLGYVVMRLALVTQWLRAARGDEARRVSAHRYALGITVCQIGWVSILALPEGWWPAGWAVLVPAELLIPAWAESASPTTWHAEHIAERYGLFMIIVLGESVLAGSIAIEAVVSGAPITSELGGIIVGGLLTLFSMWWIYFDRPEERLLSSLRTAIFWGYTHLLVFASAAAVGAGLVVNIEASAHHVELGPRAVGASLAIPVAVYLASLWVLYLPSVQTHVSRYGVPVVALAILLTPLTPAPALLTGVLLVAFLSLKVGARLSRRRRPTL